MEAWLRNMLAAIVVIVDYFKVLLNLLLSLLRPSKFGGLQLLLFVMWLCCSHLQMNVTHGIQDNISWVGTFHWPPVHGLPRIDYQNGLPEWMAKWTT